MKESKNLNDLIDALTILPGIGRKSAQRMAYKLIQSNKEKTLNLSDKLANITKNISNCKICGIYLDNEDIIEQTDDNCHLCVAQNRNPSQVCVTESPADVYMIDSSTDYKGYYFVLKGSLSPLDGRGPVEIGMKRSQTRLEKGNINELIVGYCFFSLSSSVVLVLFAMFFVWIFLNLGLFMYKDLRDKYDRTTL